MATSGTRTEYRSNRPFAKIQVVTTASNWYSTSETIILTDVLGRTVTFTAGDGAGAAGATTPTRVSATSYLFGLDGISIVTAVATRIGDAITLANMNGDLNIALVAQVGAQLQIVQLTTPQTPNKDDWDYFITVGGTAETNSEAIYVDFSASVADHTSNERNEFPVDDLYLKSHSVVSPDHILHHYDLDAVDANFNITGTSNDNPRQAPFSKRFQVIRALAGNQTTTG